MSTNIQQARDALEKWRERATQGPWAVIDGVYSDEGGTYDGSQIEAEHEMVAMDHQDLDCGPVAPLGYADARLIVGTAGNPDLLEALDEGLRQYGTMPERSVPTFIKRIAAAIIAADKRMTS
ncbi:hypothetical protein DEI97_013520 [Curtobacterium sp. MCLR17_032]|uniref:hypothetical protein n=1 Tax=Curtobacterium sp. MCLR17_032 TaxID=2175650 RepID=UPI000DA71FA7|nr:hypothetical protein [Curtobacterium sp. MCLR17_032]WIE60760.1 hypothetical protein DEI97_013520 [Curtobacterium sp. MCLR17_032]